MNLAGRNERKGYSIYIRRKCKKQNPENVAKKTTA
jgi:hypothetical protein